MPRVEKKKGAEKRVKKKSTVFSIRSLFFFDLSFFPLYLGDQLHRAADGLDLLLRQLGHELGPHDHGLLRELAGHRA